MNGFILNCIAIGLSVMAIAVTLFLAVDTRRIMRKTKKLQKPRQQSITSKYTDWQWPTNPKE